MKLAKWKRIDDNRMISDGGYIHQTKTSTGGKRLSCDVWKPTIATTNGYKKTAIKFKGVRTALARVMWLVFIGPISDESCIDHKNGDSTDNRLSNLREVTRGQNSRAFCKKKKGTSSKYRGVSLNNRSGLWCSRIMKRYKSIHIGYFGSEEEAAIAWNKKAIELGFYPEALNKV